ncbi:MAG: hypothetical protein LBH52_00450, partial [Puniceicoccales bacterium]|nr:hypothetical protein [Puniceicoccales bacterium]
MSLILSAARTHAYSPPFSYASGICDYFVKSGAWFTRMVADLGEQKFFESWYPGTLVDGAGDLYFIRNDTGGWGGPGWYINRISANSSNGISSTWSGFGINTIDSRYNDNGRFSLSGDSSETTLFKNQSWHILQPCIAQEVNGTTDYLSIFVCAPPARWTGSSNDCEGIGWVKLQKSKIGTSGWQSVVSVKLFTYENVLAISAFIPLNSNYSQNLFSAIHDVGAGKTSVYWLSTQGASGLRLNYLTLDNTGDDLVSASSHSTQCANSDTFSATYIIEPRVLKGNDKYYLNVVHDVCTYLYEANASTGNTTSHISLPVSTWSSIIESGIAQRFYHSDIGMVKASDGTEVLLMLQMAKGSYFTAIDNRWSASY